MSLYCRRGMLGHRLTKIRINRWCHIMLYTLGSLGSLMTTSDMGSHVGHLAS